MDDDPEREILIALRTTQILVGGLLFGVLSFYAVTTFLVLSNTLGVGTANAFPLPAAGCIVAVVTVMLSFVIKGLVLRRARSEAKEAPDKLRVLLQRYRAANTIAGALCEGGALAVGVFVIATGPGSLPWLAGGLISLLGFALHFPTREKLDTFLSEIRSGDESHASE